MIDNNLKALIASFTCFVFTFLSLTNLSPFILTKSNNFYSVLTKVFEIFDADVIVKWKLFTCILASMASILLCVMIITYLYSPFNEESISHIRKFVIIMWIFLLIVDILISLYTLACFVMIIILFLFILMALAGATISGSGGGGPVHVKGHYRKGSYVSGHTRRKPRHF